MHMYRLTLLIFCILGGTFAEAIAHPQDKQVEDSAEATVFKIENIAFLNPMQEFDERVGTVQVVADYIKTIEANLSPIIAKEYSDDETPKNGLVAVAIRPNGSCKFWMDVGGEFSEDQTSELQTTMDRVGAPKVVGGPVAFTINFKIWGGVEEQKLRKAGAVRPPKMPTQWIQAMKESKQKLRVPDDLLPIVWPEKNADTKSNEGDAVKIFVPDGFVLQTLDPLGGSILRPKDWHYSQSGSKQGVLWTITKEPNKNGYTTGVRIQLVAGIKKGTGKSPEEFVKDFIKDKKKTSKVLTEREATQQGGFTRIGLETEEPQHGKPDALPFRILYSCFWNNQSDMIAITTSGTTTDLWEENQEIFDTMAGLTLVDLKKAKSKRAKPKKATKE